MLALPLGDSHVHILLSEYKLILDDGVVNGLSVDVLSPLDQRVLELVWRQRSVVYLQLVDLDLVFILDLKEEMDEIIRVRLGHQAVRGEGQPMQRAVLVLEVDSSDALLADLAVDLMVIHVRHLQTDYLDGVLVGGEELVVVIHQVAVGVVFQEVFHHSDAVFSLQIVDLEVAAFGVRRMSLEDEVVEADGPLLDLVVQLELQDLLPFLVPDLEQDLLVVVQVADVLVDPQLHRGVLHLFVVGASPDALVEVVQRVQVNLVAAVLQVLLGSREVVATLGLVDLLLL
mmetsp:Transcript_24584/g.38147  ORF Transcript_24584/g.38147 Transcript_24584/m.38147 type:complete len:286 (+) Transcript_24584:2188-3045(+)